MRIEASHFFDVPVERGFAFITAPTNWSKFWPGFVRLEDGSRWAAVGDTARLVTRLLGQERELTLVLTAYQPNRLVTYTSIQPGLPPAHHERHFSAHDHGFLYHLIVAYHPRPGLLNLFDRLLLTRALQTAFQTTFAALDRELPTAPHAP